MDFEVLVPLTAIFWCRMIRMVQKKGVAMVSNDTNWDKVAIEPNMRNNPICWLSTGEINCGNY